jgi:hypothetical protein
LNREPELFWKKLFRIFHELHRGKEPDDFRRYNIRVALYSLRTFTGMTGERLAAEIGIAPGMLNMLEVRGGRMSLTHCEQCKKIARDFRYPKLAEFFGLEGMRNSRHTRTRRPEGDLADDPE